MKVIHVLKKIEQIDEDIKELRKMEKSLQRNKSFTTPIFMTIEKQINNMLGDRIKLLELEIKNPPEQYAKEFDEDKNEKITKPLKKAAKKGADKEKPAPLKKTAGTSKKQVKPQRPVIKENVEIPMMTQDMIDSRFDTMKKASEAKPSGDKKLLIDHNDDKDEDIKLLDIALEKGTLNKEEIDKEKKRVRFFRNNFPGGEY
jgi:hypothetical protein